MKATQFIAALVSAGAFATIGTATAQVAGSLPGATKDTVKALPPFEYTKDTAQRDAFIAKTEAELAKAREDISAQQKKADAAAGDAKASLDKKIGALQLDMKAAESKLA